MPGCWFIVAGRYHICYLRLNEVVSLNSQRFKNASSWKFEWSHKGFCGLLFCSILWSFQFFLLCNLIITFLILCSVFILFCICILIKDSVSLLQTGIQIPKYMFNFLIYLLDLHVQKFKWCRAFNMLLFRLIRFLLEYTINAPSLVPKDTRACPNMKYQNIIGSINSLINLVCFPPYHQKLSSYKLNISTIASILYKNAKMWMVFTHQYIETGGGNIFR